MFNPYVDGQDFFTQRVLKQARIEGKLWEDARFVIADVPLRREAVRKVLPWGMRPTEPPAATLFIADYRKTAFTIPYRESAMLVHVNTPLGEGVHCCWMVVDDDTALIYGRELLGYPKKSAVIDFVEDEEGITASVTRRGIEVLSMGGKKGRAEASPPPVFNRKTFNASGMGQFFAFNPVWLFKPREEIHASYEAEVEVALADSEYDPIADLVAGDPQRGRIAFIDILGVSYMFPVGFAGIGWLRNVFSMRIR